MPSDIKELLVATGNKGKLREIYDILSGDLNAAKITLRNLDEFPFVSEVAETGSTFAENAILKARGYAMQTNLLTLADDSGLEVEALGGAPGIYSARFGGELDDAARRAYLLAALKDAPSEERRARFVCVIALADPQSDSIQTATGECSGRITRVERGANGFGYDPIFIPDGYVETFGELSNEIKRRISHRARALAAARDILRASLMI